MEIAGRIAVVTGAASGIGAACAERLRIEGARVVTWDLTGADVASDVRDQSSVDAALRRTAAEVGPPTLLVAATGTGGVPRPFHQLEVEDLEAMLTMNLRGVFLTLRCVTAVMREVGAEGSVVAISNVDGVVSDPGRAAVAAATAGVHHLCRVAASDLGAAGIRVNVVAPGPTLSTAYGSAFDQDEIAEIESVTPLRRVGTAPLVAEAVSAVLRADWITGQVLTSDGGMGLQTARGRWRLPHAELSPHRRPLDPR